MIMIINNTTSQEQSQSQEQEPSQEPKRTQAQKDKIIIAIAIIKEMGLSREDIITINLFLNNEIDYDIFSKLFDKVLK